MILSDKSCFFTHNGITSPKKKTKEGQESSTKTRLHLAWPPKFKNQALFTPRAQNRLLFLDYFCAVAGRFTKLAWPRKSHPPFRTWAYVLAYWARVPPAAGHFPHASDCAATVTTNLATAICPWRTKTIILQVVYIWHRKAALCFTTKNSELLILRTGQAGHRLVEMINMKKKSIDSIGQGKAAILYETFHFFRGTLA